MGELDLPGQIYWLSESSFCEDGELTLSGLCWLRTVCEFFFFHLQVFPSFLPVICLYHKIETEKHTICEILGQQSPTLDTKTGGGWARRWTQWARRRAGRPGQSLPLLDQPSPSSPALLASVGHAQPLPSASFSCFPAASGRWLLTPRTGHAQLALSLSLLYHLKKGHPG